MKDKEFIEVKRKDVKVIREKFLEMNNYICPICNRKITLDEAVLDHIHGTHKSIYPNTHKLIRNAICSDCNVLLGKIENQFLRSKIEYKESVLLSNVLRNMANYIEFYSDINNHKELLIHPSEVKQRIIKKSSFNKLKKLVKENFNKNIEYPKSGKLTKQISEYSKLLGFELEYYA